MPNSATVRNAMADVVKRYQQREDILDRSSEIYNLDGDECDEEAFLFVRVEFVYSKLLLPCLEMNSKQYGIRLV